MKVYCIINQKEDVLFLVSNKKKNKVIKRIKKKLYNDYDASITNIEVEKILNPSAYHYRIIIGYIDDRNDKYCIDIYFVYCFGKLKKDFIYPYFGEDR
jgi:hypothetical protein